MCSKGFWVSNDPSVIVYTDKYGDTYNGPKALVIANQEQADYDACMRQRANAERAAQDAEAERLASGPVVDDSPLEQPATLEPIAAQNVWISTNRRYFRPWNEFSEYWDPLRWREIPQTARRVAVVQDRMCVGLYKSRSWDGIGIWTYPLRQDELTKAERRKLSQNGPLDAEGGREVKRLKGSNVGHFTKDRRWWTAPDATYRWPVSLALKLVGVVESDSWSVVYRDVSSDGKQWVSLVSWPMTWEMLSAGEQQSFSRNPLDMTAFVRPS